MLVKSEEKGRGLLVKILTWIGLFVVLVAFPNQNHSVDAWGYVADIRWGNNLFHPHHLLYAVTAKGFSDLMMTFFSWNDVLKHVLIFNALTAVFCFEVLYRILQKVKKNSLINTFLALIALFSFGTWRFATEAEVYLMPLAFCLLSFEQLMLYRDKSKLKNLFLAGLFGAVACLYHQMYIFSFIGFGLVVFFEANEFLKRVSQAMVYYISFLVVVIVYVGVLWGQHQVFPSVDALMDFVLHDAKTGQIHDNHSWMDVIKTGIGVVRSFLQIHGLVWYQLTESENRVYYILIGLVSMGAWIYGKFLFAKSSGLRQQIVENGFHQNTKPLAMVVWLSMLMFIGFAMFNNGNAEFLSMLPFLTIIGICLGFKNVEKGVGMMAVSLFIWNLTFGVYPLHALKMSAEIDMAKKYESRVGDCGLILLDRGQYINYIYYQKNKIVDNTFSPPSFLLSKGISEREVVSMIDSLVVRYPICLTDCLSRPNVANRINITYHKLDADFYGKYYRLSVYDSFQTDIGCHRLMKVEKIGRRPYP